ncbi:hypothetical protein N7650_23550, partial [Pseudomonas sp. GD04058]|uniref:hypothetical protein n=1 Tax=Pseudomonas sp. GD04058 TaxID=2975429 RepID=UPI00244A322D
VVFNDRCRVGWDFQERNGFTGQKSMLGKLPTMVSEMYEVSAPNATFWVGRIGEFRSSSD